MRHFFPVGAPLLGTALTVYGCHVTGMRGMDIVLAAIVAGVVGVTTAMTAVLSSERRAERVRR